MLIELKVKIKNRKISVMAFLLLMALGGSCFLFPSIIAAQSSSSDIDALNQKISDKKNSIDSLQKQIDAYTENIKIKQAEAKDLNDQIGILNNEIAKINLNIEVTNQKIEEANLEIQSLNIKIDQLQKQIDDLKIKISQYIRLIYKNDQISYLEVMLTNDNFSSFFDQLKYAEEIHSNLKNSLTKFVQNQADLEIEKQNLEAEVKKEEDLKNQLQRQMAELNEKNSAKQIVLLQTNLTQKQYQSYLSQLKSQQQKINSDIVSLEKSIREKLAEEAAGQTLGSSKLDWPVDPSRGISAYFHDKDYPFKYIFEHSGIDIRAYQGTKIKAPANGYVGKIQFAGNKNYAYILLIHNDGISTVYGHISATYVKTNDFVTRGQVIGLSGGMPGSVGAGPLTTGPHLHFEVRLNGIPVNPLNYLPAL